MGNEHCVHSAWLSEILLESYRIEKRIRRICVYFGYVKCNVNVTKMHDSHEMWAAAAADDECMHICIQSVGLFVCLLFVFERMDWFANCILYAFQLSVVIIIAQCKWNCMSFPHFHAATTATTTEEKRQIVGLTEMVNSHGHMQPWHVTCTQ